MNNTINPESLEDGTHHLPIHAAHEPEPEEPTPAKDLSSALNQALDWDTYQNHLL